MLRVENNYTTESASEFLSISTARVRRLIKDGRLPAEKRGRDHIIQEADLLYFASHGRRGAGRPRQHDSSEDVVSEESISYGSQNSPAIEVGAGKIIVGDVFEALGTLDSGVFQTIIADPPYFQVLLEQGWDNTWNSSKEYLDWTLNWVRECKRVLRSDGLLYIFGQLGKREHVWLHTCSMLTNIMQFHDMVIWDRAVGYNERYDSFTPQYEMVLVLRQSANSAPYFNKDAVRLPYDEERIQSYLRDKRYKDKEAREMHLRKGKYATNILRIPSLKGSSKEKIGHPSQKPLALINHLISSSSRKGDIVLDPFLGSGTTAAAAQSQGRKWVGVELNPNYAELSKKRIESMLTSPELILG